jgi:hypothetical protein
MQSSSQAGAPSLAVRRDESPAAASAFARAVRHGPAHVRIPWRRRRARSGCLFDPVGSCVLSAVLAGTEPRPALEDLVAALVSEAEDRLGAALRDRVVLDDHASEALIARRALEQWITRATQRRQRRRALAGAAVAFVSSAYTVPLCVLGDAPVRLTAGVALVVLTAGSALAALVFLRRAQTGWPLPQLIAGLLCATGVGIFLIVEGVIGRVVVGDEVATLIGLAAAGVSLLIQAGVARLAE